MRITEKDLEAKVIRLNKTVGFNNPKWSEIGSYSLSYAYGGVNLHQFTNAAGGVKEVFSCGHVPKKELYNLISAYEAGLSK